MSIRVFTFSNGECIHAEPSGQLKQKGWLPGTWIKIINEAPKVNKNVFAVIDICGYDDFPAGFLVSGSSSLKQMFDCKFPNSNESTGQWTSDQMLYLTATVPDTDIHYENNMLSHMGTGIACFNLQNTGGHKFYVYEKYDLAYRTSNGASGSLLNWNNAIGKFEALYVSSRGLLTCEKENPNQKPLSFLVLSKLKDDNGEFIAIVSD